MFNDGFETAGKKKSEALRDATWTLCYVKDLDHYWRHSNQIPHVAYSNRYGPENYDGDTAACLCGHAVSMMYDITISVNLRFRPSTLHMTSLFTFFFEILSCAVRIQLEHQKPIKKSEIERD